MLRLFSLFLFVMNSRFLLILFMLSLIYLGSYLVTYYRCTCVESGRSLFLATRMEWKGTARYRMRREVSFLCSAFYLPGSR